MTKSAAQEPSPRNDEGGSGLFSWASAILPVRLILYDAVRLAISIGGLGFAVMLVIVLRGIMDGTVAKSTAYIDHSGADLFVAREGVNHMALASSTIPEPAVGVATGVEGVSSASGVIRVNAIAFAGNLEQPAQLIGYDPGAPRGGPWRLSAGRGVQSDGEVVADDVLARQLGLGIGDSLQLADMSFEIVGLSSGTAAIAGKLVFISLGDAQRLLQMPGLVSFILVEVSPGYDNADVTARLAGSLSGVEVLSRSELSINDRDLLGSLFVKPVNVTSTVGLIVGLAIVGLTMYTTTAERLRDYGVLRAIGAPHRFLLQTVIVQAIALCVAGFAAGIAASVAAAPMIERFAPEIGIAYAPLYSLQVFAAILAMGILGASIPIARILRVDPLMVFRR